MDLRSMKLAHDMKMPIQLIYSCVQLLEMEIAPDGKAKDYLRMLTRSAGQLQMMVHNVLDVDQIERGCDSVRLKKTDVSGEVRDFCRQCDLFAREENRRVVFMANAERLYMMTDGEKLRRILQNLISNALKATQPGGRVRVELLSLGDAVEIAVRDDGPGIAVEQMERIFLPGESTGGHGYGLSIVREYAGLLGGSIRVESEEGKGSSFILRLPHYGTGRMKASI